MKQIISIILFIVFLPAITYAGETEIITHTAGWDAVPIVVDLKTKTYRIVGKVPADNRPFYYAFDIYRCLEVKRDIYDHYAFILHPSVISENDIFCYPEDAR